MIVDFPQPGSPVNRIFLCLGLPFNFQTPNLKFESRSMKYEIPIANDSNSKYSYHQNLPIVNFGQLPPADAGIQ